MTRVVKAFLAVGQLRLRPIAPDELPRGLAPSDKGRLRILPGAFEEAGGADTFFIARFAK